MESRKITKDEDHAATILSEAAKAASNTSGMVAIASNWLGGGKFTDLHQRASDLAGELQDLSRKLWRHPD